MHPSHAIHASVELFKKLPRIKKKKNPFIAALLGFFLGGIGLGLYFRSWLDFLGPIIVFVILSIAIPAIGTFAALVLTTVWGFARAMDSGTE